MATPPLGVRDDDKRGRHFSKVYPLLGVELLAMTLNVLSEIVILRAFSEAFGMTQTKSDRMFGDAHYRSPSPF